MNRAEMYQLRAEECLAMALDAHDEGHVMQAVQMAMYWFGQAERGYESTIARHEADGFSPNHSAAAM